MSGSDTIRIAIAEDNSFALKVILDKLENEHSVSVVTTASNGIELIQKIKEAGRIDAILMDIEMPRQDGIETTRLVKSQFPNIRILMLTIFDDDEKIFEAIMAGADGYLLKEEKASKIIQCVHEVMEGGAGMSPAIAGRVLKLVQHGRPAIQREPSQNFDLTRRELEILEQLKAGLSYERIGENLFISYGTVRKHIENVYRKLQVHNKVEAVQKAIQEKLI